MTGVQGAYGGCRGYWFISASRKVTYPCMSYAILPMKQPISPNHAKAIGVPAPGRGRPSV